MIKNNSIFVKKYNLQVPAWVIIYQHHKWQALILTDNSMAIMIIPVWYHMGLLLQGVNRNRKKRE